MMRNKKLNHDLPKETVSTQLPLPVLPEELILEILLRLPVTSIPSFNLCVSRSWKTLISCPQFAKTHLQISTAEPNLSHQQLLVSNICEPNNCRIYSYPLKPLFENSLTRVEPGSFTVTMSRNIVGSCNGLLCMCSQRRFTLYNPSIRFISKNSPESSSLDYVPWNYGFGYDQVNDKYKVLLVERNTNNYLTKIYTFGEDSWKTIPNFPCTLTMRLGKFVAGTLNWMVDKRGVMSNQKLILSFDLEKETYGEVLLPQSDGDYMCKDMLYVLSNCLCVFFFNKTHWVAWLMKEHGVVESWTKLMIIPHEKFIWKSLNAFLDVNPLFISENGFVLLVKELSYRLVLYNLNNGRLGYPLGSFYFGFDQHIYRESLISPRW